MGKILLLIIYCTQTFTSKTSYLLFDSLLSCNTEAIDSFSLFCYMREKKMKAYYLLREDSSLYKKLKSEDKLEHIIPFSGKFINSYEIVFRTFFVLIKAKAVITSFGGAKRTVAKFLFKNKYISYIYIDHGVIFFKESIFFTNYISSNNYNYTVISNDLEKEILLSHGWKKEQLIIGGLPRWDWLKIEKNKLKTIFIYFTWRRTFKEKFEIPHSVYCKNLKSLLENQRLHTEMKNRGIQLVLGIHHALADLFSEKLLMGENIQVADSTQISNWIQKSDLLVTDYSSIAFDFLFLNKPVIYYRLDDGDSKLGCEDQNDFASAKTHDSEISNVFYHEEACVDKVIEYIQSDFRLTDTEIKASQKFFYQRENIRESLVSKIKKLSSKALK